MGRRPQPQRRAALLEACADDLLAAGLAGATLARMAEAAAASPRMLIYHFKTRDQLVIEALHTARRRQRASYDHVLDPVGGVRYSQVLRDAWNMITQPDARPYLSLFSELHDLPDATSPWPGFRAQSIQDWLPVIERGLRADGHLHASALATLLVASTRGLLSDLSTTGDLERTTAAWCAATELLDHVSPPATLRPPHDASLAGCR